MKKRSFGLSRGRNHESKSQTLSSEFRIPNLNGVLVVDKPAGISSAKAVAIVKRLLKVRKIGHAGALDPLATGILVCCLNRATRLAYFFLKSTKTYKAVLHLGVETDTQDATGEITAQCRNSIVNEAELSTINAVMKRFEGKSKQMPPVYSALKHKGVPLYKLARRGEPVQKPAREVVIKSIRIDAIELPYIRFTVSCSAGAYIRTLCADIGAALGYGGHLKALRRVASGSFTIRQAIGIDELEKSAGSDKFRDALSARIIPASDALTDMPVHVADKDLADRIRHGQQIPNSEFRIPNSKWGNFIKITDTTNNLLAIVENVKEKRHYRYWGVFNAECEIPNSEFKIPNSKREA
ncbi:tRNA pseudouridine(55) synthase TruB [Desulfococcaceae bacterium HSG7]|nr:tRNA pseudouridine(55) synthase TruB [Desulfococcaceae bacterium HSG9]MDM8554970.1 tRNA pseudouridine(55) synthase TruB [Desulfococcaceae bacterium HSG7]